MSFVFIFVVSSSCIPVHVSRTCSCDYMVSVHLRHLVSLYFPLKLFFTSSILVLALKMVDASILFNSFMYFGRSPAFQVAFSRRNCIFVFPPLVFSMLCRKYLFSCCGYIPNYSANEGIHLNPIYVEKNHGKRSLSSEMVCISYLVRMCLYNSGIRYTGIKLIDLMFCFQLLGEVWAET